MQEAGREIDGFPIVRELGRGGMGVVYEARHPTLHRSMALKLFSAETDPEHLLRFAREAELLARVRHPNVVTIHSFGRAPEGPYLVTELVEGETLQALVRKGPVAPARAANLVRQVAAGLAVLHELGVVHRDVKPANVIVTCDGNAKLLDFGLAKDVGAERLTQTGAIMGTPEFMAPEQASGGSGSTVDARVDVYGLGAILFALLSGRAPFQASSLLMVLAKVASEEPRWPSRDQPQTPPALEAICKRAMAKEPARRYASALDMAHELDRFLAGESRGAGLAPRALALGAVALVAVAIAAVAITSALGVRTSRTGPPEDAPPRPIPTAATLTQAQVVRGDRALQNALLYEGPARLSALDRWLRDYPGHPQAPKGRAAHRAVQITLPLLTFQCQLSSYRTHDRRTRVRFLNESRLITAGADRQVRVWDVSQSSPNLVWETTHPLGHPKSDLVVSRDGAWLVVGGGQGSYRLDAATGTQRELLEALSPFAVRGLSFSPDGTLLAVGTATKGAKLLTWPAGDLVHTFEKFYVVAPGFSPSGRRFAAASGYQATSTTVSDWALTVWDVESKFVLHTIPIEAPTRALVFASEDALLVGTNVGKILVVDLENPHAPQRAWVGAHAAKESNASEALFDPTVKFDRRVFIGGDRAHPSGILGMELSGDGKTLFSAGGAEDKISEFKVWAYPAGEELHAVTASGAIYYSFDLSPGGTRLAVADTEGVVRVFVAAGD